MESLLVNGLLIVFLFTSHYYLFRWYLRRKKEVIPHLAWTILGLYIVSYVVSQLGALFFLLPFIALGTIAPVIAILVFVAVGIVAFTLVVKFLQHRLRLKWFEVATILVAPVVVALAIWQAFAFWNAHRPPPQYKEGDISDITYGGIRLTSPNGGEVLTIGSTVPVKWKAMNIQDKAEGAQLDVELFEITGDKPAISEKNTCLNCTESGLRSGISVVPIKTGNGSASWVVGKLYSGGYVNPGTRYIMKATVSKTGNADECPAQFPTCSVELDVDWSDAAFTLTN